MYRMAAKIDEVLLIELVRKHECLYNMNNKHYRDQNMRGEAWEEIAQDNKHYRDQNMRGEAWEEIAQDMNINLLHVPNIFFFVSVLITVKLMLHILVLLLTHLRNYYSP
ncbi:Alcohol dehydrogenase transcription factor Myb/SANT-like [Popillia japonica]|uniref:Alcohol dehydrogenase transcription factor Myb/SANT-like n=1 Tax=Popillia japonica TaxID=7064 RepID=A0AAW1LV63_POPJA